jgi:hypothetical protein
MSISSEVLWLSVIAFNLPGRGLSGKTYLPMRDIGETDDPTAA